MGNTKKAKSFVKKRFEYLLKRYGLSKNQFAKLMFPKTKQPLRKLLKYLASEEMPLEVLLQFASTFNCYPGYLDGSINIDKEYLRQQFGDDYIVKHVRDEDFDPDGYYMGFYTTINKDELISPLRERAILFLNENTYTYEATLDKNLNLHLRTMPFDFHDLDEGELDILTFHIFELVERIILNPPSQEWKDFIETTKRKNGIQGGSHDSEKEKKQ